MTPGSLPTEQTTAQPFFDAVYGALRDTLKTLCQDKIDVAEPVIAEASELEPMIDNPVGLLNVTVRDKEGWSVSLLAPAPAMMTLTGLSLYMDSDEIEAMRTRETPSEDDIDGLDSLADQLLSGIGTAIREATGGPFAFEHPSGICKTLSTDDAKALLDEQASLGRYTLTIEEEEGCELFFVAPLALTAELNPVAEPEPAPTAALVVPPVPTAAPNASGPSEPNLALNRLLKIEVPVIVVLAETMATTQEVLEITEGTVIQFVKSDEELLDLLANNKQIGRGKVVKVGKKIGLRLEQIGNAKEIINTL